MKKMFPLHLPRKADARVLDAIKHEVRKYVRRELNKLNPEGVKRRTFACRVGATPAEAESVALKGISAAIDRVAQGGADHVYIAIKPVAPEEPPR